MGFYCQEGSKYSWGIPQAVGRREGKRRQDSEKGWYLKNKMSESHCFLRCEASSRRWLHLTLVVSLVHQGLFSLVLLGVRIITLFSRGFRVAASYCIIECFVEGEGELWTENVRSQN